VEATSTDRRNTLFFYIRWSGSTRNAGQLKMRLGVSTVLGGVLYGQYLWSLSGQTHRLPVQT